MATQTQVETLRGVLETMKQSVQEERQTVERQRLELSEREPELEEQGQKEASRIVLEQEEGRLRDRLRQVDDALLRIGAGTYGRCQACGQDIDPRRLQAMPWTPLCRDCADSGQPGSEEAGEMADLDEGPVRPIDV